MSIVRNVNALPLNRAMIAAIVAYADRVGSKVVAEGVETAEESDALKTLGVHMGQGWLFGRPTPASELTDIDYVVSNV